MSEARLLYGQEYQSHQATEGNLCHFCFGLDKTQVEKSPIEQVVNFNSTRKTVCFTPVRMVKCSISVPLMRTAAVSLSQRSLRIVMKLVGKPNMDRPF